MSRTIEEIKADMTANFIKQKSVISAYGLDEKKSFDQQFSSVSIENIMFYVFAVALWTLEKLFDLHSTEVAEQIAELKPHTLRWYVNKTKAFMYRSRAKLVPGTDYYDTTGMSETDIEASRVVKYAVATESNTVVYIKVAGEDKDGNPCQLNEYQIKALNAYINTIKDAGVSVVVRNEPADLMRVKLVVYYDPIQLTKEGESLSEGGVPIEDTVKSVIKNLPFNGVYRNSDLISTLQAISGVEAVDIVSVEVKPNSAEEWTDVVGFTRPYSGYYEIESLDVEYRQYSTEE